ncbi:4-hydroxy-3-methylbut-2-enyl diphosphate reductase [Cerasicoccus fimbriatus]|uniref:4-hydroxy-3-methylbut-2-enyl diphosphate reductase n=1 Tax=Cerasicoccus fimbriatus TaxID=3014554 RepID=UPI0022B4ABC5|nr:4-hydroxy-3-methylbut-2-enyl diphosphate reductase [Cerasicoccus sp. TK19100]
MNVITAPSAGFCWGVERAIEIARKHAGGEQRVYTDGPLIHNRQMMEQLEAEGISEVGDFQSQAPLHLEKGEDGVMVVRAHGVSPQRRAYLKSLGMQFKDATCPDVGIIAGKVKLHARKGYQVVIFGDPKHPEVIGILGYAVSGGHVIRNDKDIAALPDLGDKVCMVSQSTMFVDEFHRLAKLLKDRFSEAIIIDTICGATRERQDDIGHLIKKGVEAVVVVGGRHSANTIKLASLVERKGLPAYHVESPAELDVESLKRYELVGLTAGASTPAYLIDAVREKLEAS